MSGTLGPAGEPAYDVLPFTPIRVCQSCLSDQNVFGCFPITNSARTLNQRFSAGGATSLQCNCISD